MSELAGTTTDTPTTKASSRAWLMLIMATLGFAVNFWAWALLSPLGPLWRDNNALSLIHI